MAHNQSSSGLHLSQVPGRFAICRLEPGTSVPAWANVSGFYSVTQTADELSIVCPEKAVPDGVTVERGWCCLKVAGPLDFSLTGVLAALAAPLAVAKISLFAISTYDTDYLMVKIETLETAITALRKAGHTVSEDTRSTS